MRSAAHEKESVFFTQEKNSPDHGFLTARWLKAKRGACVKATMGILGAALGNIGGKLAGGELGQRIAGSRGRVIGEGLGGLVGGLAGAAIPFFEKGGRVKGRGPRLAVVHGGEYVLPKGVAPTLLQTRAVAKRKNK